MMWQVFSCISLVSAVLCVAAVLVWVRSYFAAEMLDVDRGDIEVQMGAADGAVYMQIARERPFHRHAISVNHFTQVPPASVSNLNMYRELGTFHLESPVLSYATMSIKGEGGSAIPLPLGEMSLIVWPLWLTVALFALLPLSWAASFPRHRRRVRISKGLCPRCAYNLTGCTSDHCPECGEAVPASTSTS